MNTLLRTLLATSITTILLVGCAEKSETDKAAEAAGAAVTEMAKSTMDAAKQVAEKTQEVTKAAADATVKAATETKDEAVEAKDKAVDVVDAASVAAKKEAAK